MSLEKYQISKKVISAIKNNINYENKEKYNFNEIYAYKPDLIFL